MLIKKCFGYELIQAQPNTSEDFFNRSEVTFILENEEKTLHVLYVRYFDEIFSEFVPFPKDPVWEDGENRIFFKDIVALIFLIKNPGLRERKRLYISSKEEFAYYFKDIDFDKLPEIFSSLAIKKEFELHPLDFIKK